MLSGNKKKTHRIYQKRTYRNQLHSDGLPMSYRVVVKETDLYVRAGISLEELTRDLILRQRGYVEAYIKQHPAFSETLVPWILDDPAPAIIRDMADASQKAGVGPMAAVAGAIAEHVGMELLDHSESVIVENGGDVFIKSHQAVVIGIFANKSPLSLRVGLQIDSIERPVAVCTSSGTVGHSMSTGKADAVCVLSRSCALADAAATAVGNQIQTTDDIQGAIEFAKDIKGVGGVVAIKNDKIGMWGAVQVVPLTEKKVEF